MAQFEDALVMPQQGCRVEDGEYFFLFFSVLFLHQIQVDC